MNGICHSGRLISCVLFCFFLRGQLPAQNPSGALHLYEFDARSATTGNAQPAGNHQVIFYVRPAQSAAIDATFNHLLVAFSDASSQFFFPESSTSYYDGVELGKDSRGSGKLARIAYKIRLTPAQYQLALGMKNTWQTQINASQLATTGNAGNANADILENAYRAATNPALMRQNAMGYASAIVKILKLRSGAEQLAQGSDPVSWLQAVIAENNGLPLDQVKTAAAAAVASKIHSQLQSEWLLANQEGKRLLVEFSATWCPSCKNFEQTLANPYVKSTMAAKYRFVKIQTDLQKEYADAQKFYRADTIPRTIKFNPDGSVHSELKGAASVETFMQFLGK